MKKILHISKYYYPFVGGIEQTARDCVHVLKDSADQKVFCFNHQKGDITDSVDGIDVIRCDCQLNISSQAISKSLSKKLKDTIDEFNPDYILFHYPNPFVAHFLLKYIKNDCKLIVYWHLDIIKQKILGKFFHKQNILLLKRAFRVISTSPNYIEGSKYLSKFKNKCVVIPSCINEKRLAINDRAKSLSRQIRSKYSGKILCLAVGRHVEYKGFEYLIESGKRLDDKYVICITGKGRLTEKLKKQAGDSKNICFLGPVDDDTLKAYFLASDIFCFSSITKNEAFGLALAEAMYFELPAVTYHIPGSGVNYVSVNNVTGIEIENRNYIAYAEAIEKLGNDPELRKKFGSNGKKRVESHFLFSQFRKNINEFFNG